MSVDNPISDVLNAVALCGQPPKGELDTLAETLTGGEFSGASISRPALREALASGVNEILHARSEGSFGEARRIARDTAARLLPKLGEQAPRAETRDVREIIESIPRGR